MTRRTTKPLAAAAVLALAASTVLAGCSRTFTFNDDMHEQTLSASMLAPARAEASGLDVVSYNGRITVLPADGSEITVTADIRAKSAKRARDTQIIAETRDDTIYVTLEFPGGRQNGEGGSISITTPPLDALRARSHNGRIECSADIDSLDLDTSNGRIEIACDATSVNAKSSNGKIICQNIEGNANLRTSNGRIEVGLVRGDLVANTSNGKIIAGPISGRFDLDTSNGSVKVLLDPAFNGTINADSSHYSKVSFDPAGLQTDAEIDLKKTSVNARIGQGPSSRIDTSNGSISIEVAHPEHTNDTL